MFTAKKLLMGSGDSAPVEITEFGAWYSEGQTNDQQAFASQVDDPTKVINTWKDGGTFYAVVGQISAGSISWGTPISFTKTGPNWGGGTVVLLKGGTKAVMTYRNNTTSNNYFKQWQDHIRVLTISGTSITGNAEQTIFDYGGINDDQGDVYAQGMGLHANPHITNGLIVNYVVDGGAPRANFNYYFGSVVSGSSIPITTTYRAGEGHSLMGQEAPGIYPTFISSTEVLLGSRNVTGRNTIIHLLNNNSSSGQWTGSSSLFSYGASYSNAARLVKNPVRPREFLWTGTQSYGTQSASGVVQLGSAGSLTVNGASGQTGMGSGGGQGMPFANVWKDGSSTKATAIEYYGGEVKLRLLTVDAYTNTSTAAVTYDEIKTWDGVSSLHSPYLPHPLDWVSGTTDTIWLSYKTNGGVDDSVYRYGQMKISYFG